jgi:hypothetical protein
MMLWSILCLNVYPKESAPLSKTSAFLANIRLGWKGLPGANGEAYLATSSVMKKKTFNNIDTSVSVIKHFPSSLTLQIN